MPRQLFQKGHKKLPGAGRAPGTANVQTRAVRAVIAEAAERLGGVERIIEWAQESAENERIFWSSMYMKLLPQRIEGTGLRGEIELNVAIKPDELSQKLIEHGLAPTLYGYDAPQLNGAPALIKARPNEDASKKENGG
jgi:hypothetical protein